MSPVKARIQPAAYISSHISVNTSDPVLLTSIHAGAVTSRASSLLDR